MCDTIYCNDLESWHQYTLPACVTFDNATKKILVMEWGALLILMQLIYVSSFSKSCHAEQSNQYPNVPKSALHWFWILEKKERVKWSNAHQKEANKSISFDQSSRESLWDSHYWVMLKLTQFCCSSLLLLHRQWVQSWLCHPVRLPFSFLCSAGLWIKVQSCQHYWNVKLISV